MDLWFWADGVGEAGWGGEGKPLSWLKGTPTMGAGRTGAAAAGIVDVGLLKYWLLALGKTGTPP